MFIIDDLDKLVRDGDGDVYDESGRLIYAGATRNGKPAKQKSDIELKFKPEFNKLSVIEQKIEQFTKQLEFRANELKSRRAYKEEMELYKTLTSMYTIRLGTVDKIISTKSNIIKMEQAKRKLDNIDGGGSALQDVGGSDELVALSYLNTLGGNSEVYTPNNLANPENVSSGKFTQPVIVKDNIMKPKNKQYVKSSTVINKAAVNDTAHQCTTPVDVDDNVTDNTEELVEKTIDMKQVNDNIDEFVDKTINSNEFNEIEVSEGIPDMGAASNSDDADAIINMMSGESEISGINYNVSLDSLKINRSTKGLKPVIKITPDGKYWKDIINEDGSSSTDQTFSVSILGTINIDKVNNLAHTDIGESLPIIEVTEEEMPDAVKNEWLEIEEVQKKQINLSDDDSVVEDI